VNTAAVSSVTTIPPIQGHNRFLRLARSAFKTFPPDLAPAGIRRTKLPGASEPVPMGTCERSETHAYPGVGRQNAYFWANLPSKTENTGPIKPSQANCCAVATLLWLIRHAQVRVLPRSLQTRSPTVGLLYARCREWYSHFTAWVPVQNNLLRIQILGRGAACYAPACRGLNITAASQ
jgi:hypothetical protein